MSHTRKRLKKKKVNKKSILESGLETLLHGVGVPVRHLPAAVNADDEQESSQGVGAVHRWSFCWEDGRKRFIRNVSMPRESEWETERRRSPVELLQQGR